MGAGRAFNRESPFPEFVDRGNCMTSGASFEILEVTPLPYTSRNLVVPVLWVQISHHSYRPVELACLPLVLNSHDYLSSA